MNAETVPLALWQVLEARRLLAGVLPRTPLYHSGGLSALCGAAVHVKYENHSPIGSFKARGAVVALAKAVEAAERSGSRLAGAVAASTGNHGLGVAYAGQRLRVPVTVYVPHGANPDKCRLIEHLGARVAVGGWPSAGAISTRQERRHAGRRPPTASSSSTTATIRG